MSIIHKGFKYRLGPTKEQVSVLRQHAGNTRFLWNHMLALNQLEYQKTQTFVGSSKMQKMLPEYKRKHFAFLALSHSQSLQQVCKNLDVAIRDAVGPSRPYKKGFPTFKRKGARSDSFTINQKFKVTRKRIYIPKVGWVQWVKHRGLQGKPKSITVSQDGEQWYVSVRCEVQTQAKPPSGDDIVGIDLGLTDFAVPCVGEPITHPKHLHKSERRLKRAHKALSHKKKGSNNRERAKRKVRRIHRSIRNQRLDFVHKLSHRLIKNHDGVAVENLNVKGMMRNRCLSKAIGASGWGEFKRQLRYKATWYGKHYVEVGCFYPSSKTCSSCAHVKATLALSERTYRCDACGFEAPRDKNAAINIREEGLRILGEEGILT